MNWIVIWLVATIAFYVFSGIAYRKMDVLAVLSGTDPYKNIGALLEELAKFSAKLLFASIIIYMFIDMIY